jgi:hypothetical protein
MKILSPKLTAICMERRDNLKQSAMELRSHAEAEHQLVLDLVNNMLAESKKKLHNARIKANQMERESEIIQESINEELALEIKKDQEASSAYDFKSNAHLAAIYEDMESK